VHEKDNMHSFIPDADSVEKRMSQNELIYINKVFSSDYLFNINAFI